MLVQVRQQGSGGRQEGLEAKLLKGKLQHGLAAGSKVEERLGGEERGGRGRGLRGRVGEGGAETASTMFASYAMSYRKDTPREIMSVGVVVYSKKAIQSTGG